VTWLVRHVGSNGEVHETPILTTYHRRNQDEEENGFENLDVGTPSSVLSLFFFFVRG
jgi:hypothetical protein